MKNAAINKKVRGNSLNSRRIRKLLKNKLACVGFVVFVLVILACLCAPLLTSYDPNAISPTDKFLPISKEHILGTDQLGRDMFARILYGGRISISLALCASLLTGFVGVVMGCIAGYCGGKVDNAIMVSSEFIGCFPSNILTLLVIGFLGQSIVWMVAVWVFTGWSGTMRMVRSRILSLREEAYVDSCRVNGLNGAEIMFKHLLPNTIGIVIMSVTSAVGGYVLAEAGLSFLGFGLSPSMASWGNIINAAKNLDIMINHPQMWIIPGVAISIFVLSCNFFGDGLRDVLDVTQ